MWQIKLNERELNPFTKLSFNDNEIVNDTHERGVKELLTYVVTEMILVMIKWQKLLMKGL